MPTYIAGYEIDAVLSEDKTSDAEITDNPIESGGDTTDHMHVKPKIVTLDLMVSDTPLPELAIRRGADVLPSDTARQFLEGLQLDRKPVVLSKKWTRADGSEGSKTYDNMLIQNLTESINPDTGDCYRVKATFKQATFVKNERTLVKVAVPRAKKKNDRGNKATEEGHPPEAPKRRGSVLKGVVSGESFQTGVDDVLDAAKGLF